MSNQPEQNPSPENLVHDKGSNARLAAYERARRKRWKEANPELHQQQLAELREYAEGYRGKNRAIINAKKREASKAKLINAANNPEELEAIRAKRRAAHHKWINKVRAENPEQYRKALNRKNARMRGWQKEHRIKSPAFKMAQAARTRINDALRGKSKAGPLVALIGCTPSQLVSYLESKFKDGMNWGNHGKGYGKWTIDHVIPLASADLNDPAEQKRCFHYSNMEPMWWIDNCRKTSSYNGKKHFHAPTEAQNPLPLPP